MYCITSSRALARNPLDILIEKEEREEGYVESRVFVGIEQQTREIIIMGTHKDVARAINKQVKQIKLVDEFIMLKKE